MKLESQLVVAPDHPAIAGHFPGFPVVPGVLLLDEMLHLHATATGQEVTRIASAKFLRPVAPGQPVALEADSQAGSCRFSAVSGTERVATGQLAVGT